MTAATPMADFGGVATAMLVRSQSFWSLGKFDTMSKKRCQLLLPKSCPLLCQFRANQEVGSHFYTLEAKLLVP